MPIPRDAEAYLAKGRLKFALRDQVLKAAKRWGSSCSCRQSPRAFVWTPVTPMMEHGL